MFGRPFIAHKLLTDLIFFRDATDESTSVSESQSKKRQRDPADCDSLPPKKAKKKKNIDVVERQIDRDETCGDESRVKNKLADKSSTNEQLVVSKRPDTDAVQPDESKTVLKRKKKKKKKKKTAVDGVESERPTSSVVRTVDIEDNNVKQTKRKKKNSKKLPPISEDRLKAYGISVKKFKYVHSKKLMAE